MKSSGVTKLSGHSQFTIYVDVAWRKVLQSVSEYQAEHREVDTDVAVAVPDDRIMAQGQAAMREL